MKICPVGAELFHPDRERETDGRPDGYDENTKSLFAILRSRPKTETSIKILRGEFLHYNRHCRQIPTLLSCEESQKFWTS